MQERINKLLEVVSEGDRLELVMLNNGFVKATSENKEKNTKETLKTWRSIKVDLEVFINDLEKKHKLGTRLMEWQEYQDTDVPKEVHRQLEAMGYDIAQSTFYRHCERGKCAKNDSGLYTRRMVSDYVKAESLLRNGETEGSSPGPDMSLSLEKQRLENEKLRLHNKRENIKAAKDDGSVIEREGLYLEIAARLVALDGMYRQRHEMDATQIITAVGGDISKLPEYNEMVFAIWEELMTEFGNVEEFEVLFEDQEEQ